MTRNISAVENLLDALVDLVYDDCPKTMGETLHSTGSCVGCRYYVEARGSWFCIGAFAIDAQNYINANKEVYE